MELILLKDIEHVGRKGDVINVRDGFARNFLLPQGCVLPCTQTNQKFVDDQKARAAKRREKEKAGAEVKAAELVKAKLVIEARAGEQEKLFGSVTAEDIKEVLAQKGFVLDKKQIHLKEPIRTVGVHQISVELYPQVKTDVSVEVVRKS